MYHNILNRVLEALKEKYGDLDDDCGCYKDNGQWFSIARVVEIIKEVDEEY